jgi:thiamine monophosphate kinase
MLTNLLHLKRPELKVKIIDGPEVLSVANHNPVVVRTLAFVGDEYALVKTTPHSERTMSHC